MNMPSILRLLFTLSAMADGFLALAVVSTEGAAAAVFVWFLSCAREAVIIPGDKIRTSRSFFIHAFLYFPIYSVLWCGNRNLGWKMNFKDDRTMLSILINFEQIFNSIFLWESGNN